MPHLYVADHMSAFELQDFVNHVAASLTSAFPRFVFDMKAKHPRNDKYVVKHVAYLTLLRGPRAASGHHKVALTAAALFWSP